jgi:hypothetical protein
MSTSENAKFFEALDTMLIAPVFFFLSFVLNVMMIYGILHTARHPNYLILGCLLFILGYNAFRFGYKKMKGTC